MTKAVEAARVEEEFQISSWGLVEGGHDYDRLNCSIQLRSGEVFTKTIKMDNKL
jgi:ATP synthase F1 complex assembly factor 2